MNILVHTCSGQHPEPAAPTSSWTRIPATPLSRTGPFRGQRDFLISGSFLHCLVEVVRKSPRLNIVRKPRQVDRSSCTEMCCWPLVTPRSGRLRGLGRVVVDQPIPSPIGSLHFWPIISAEAACPVYCVQYLMLYQKLTGLS